ncbi:hypothetical protein J6TS7_20630 [Paenibacillus dendritiformis]|nr:hypothetical protein J6TS7_20630 [Paenibacillus dendritiformis]
MAIIQSIAGMAGSLKGAYEDATEYIGDLFSWGGDDSIPFATIASNWMTTVMWKDVSGQVQKGLSSEMKELLDELHVGLPSSVLFAIFEMSEFVKTEEDVTKVAALLEPQNVNITIMSYEEETTTNGKTVLETKTKAVVSSLDTYVGRVTLHYDAKGRFDRNEISEDFKMLDRALKVSGLSVSEDEKEFLFAFAKIDNPSYVPGTGGNSGRHDVIVIDDGALLQWPLPNHYYLSSPFGTRTDPITGKKEAFHKGIDIPAPMGTKAVAAESGTVVEAKYGWNGGRGNYITIETDLGYDLIYMHVMGKGILVEENSKVQRGEAVVKVGSTGSSTGAHLHFQVEKDGKLINPLQVLKKK